MRAISGNGHAHPLWARAAAAPASSYAYALSSGDLIKLGRSNSPEIRWRGINSQSPVPVDLVGFWPETLSINEGVCHAEFRAERHHGEWFRGWEVSWFVNSMPTQFRFKERT